LTVEVGYGAHRPRAAGCGEALRLLASAVRGMVAAVVADGAWGNGAASGGRKG